MYSLTFLLAFADISFAWAAEDKDPFQPEILVQAKAVRVTNDRDMYWQKATFRIEHVYSGDAKLRGTMFQASFKRERGGVSTQPDDELEPPIKQGEEGIWYLMRGDEDSKLIPVIHNQGTHENDALVGWSVALPVPARKIVGEQYRGYFGARGAAFIIHLR